MRRAALIFLGAGSPLLLVSLLTRSVAPAVALAVAFPVALMALGAVGGRAGRLFPAVLLVLLVLLEGSFFAMLQLRGRVEEAAWPLGVPLSALILWIGVGLVPLLIVPVAYALAFRRQGISAEDLERVRSRREAR